MTRTTKGNNPGKNKKDQISRARIHHKGAVKVQYVEDPERRSQILYKRKPTVFKKMDELSVMTKTHFVVEWKTESGSTGTYTTMENDDGKHADKGTVEVSQEGVHYEATDPVYPPPPEAGPSTHDQDQLESGDCAICKKKHASKKSRDLWLNCEYRNGCSYWVHCLCIGIVAKKDQDLADVKYFCPQHIEKYKN